MEKFYEQLKNLKEIKPRSEWRDTQRELLLNQITRQITDREPSKALNYWLLFKSVLPTGFVKFIARPAGIVSALAVLIFSSGVFSVSASKGSLPGDILYPVKLTSEKVKVGLAEKGEQKAKLHVEIAEERVREIEKVVQQETSSESKQVKVKIAAEGLKKEMENAKKELDKVKDIPKSTKTAVNVVKELDEKADAISEKVQAVKTTQTAEVPTTVKADDSVKAIVKTLNEATVATDQTGVKAVEVMVEKHAAGDITMTDKEVIKVVEKKLIKTENKVKEVAEKVTKATEAVNEAAKDAAKDVPADPAGSGEAKPDEAKQAEVKAQEQIVVEIKDKPSEAEKILTEAKDLLNQGDLNSVLEKVKQSTAIVDEVTTKVENLSINKLTETKTEQVVPPESTTPPTTVTPVEPAKTETPTAETPATQTK